MRLEVNRVHWPVTALGPGRRIGIWVQGCSIRCSGCVSVDTWDRVDETGIQVADLVTMLRDLAPSPDGITVSGGEPFDQPEALLELLEAIRAWRIEEHLSFDVLCYSGYQLRRLRSRHAAILGLLDAVISEPFVETLPTTLIWRGSLNQKLTPLSARGRRVYEGYVDFAPENPPFQVAASDEALWFVGVPSEGDLEAVEAALRCGGVEPTEVSWRR